MRDFKKFLEEVDIEGNLGIPGQGGRRRGEPDYLSDVTARAKGRLGIAGGRQMPPIEELMRNLGESQRLSSGHEEELEELATQVITDLYGPILDHYGIRLDIKFATGHEIRGLIDRGYQRTRHARTGQDVRPVVRARGVDFSMLIHEAVKGIWQVMSMTAAPPGELGKAIERAFDLRDEPEEWRYGPEIAADLRDFVNENPKVDSYPNLREELWKHMVDHQKMPAADFVELMRGILSKTPEARRKVDELIDEVAKKLDRRKEDKVARERYQRELREYERQMEEYNRKMEEYRRARGVVPEEKPKAQAQAQPDYDSMSDSELQRELDAALDAGDFAKARFISTYLK